MAVDRVPRVAKVPDKTPIKDMREAILLTRALAENVEFAILHVERHYHELKTIKARVDALRLFFKEQSHDGQQRENRLDANGRNDANNTEQDQDRCKEADVAAGERDANQESLRPSQR